MVKLNGKAEYEFVELISNMVNICIIASLVTPLLNNWQTTSEERGRERDPSFYSHFLHLVVFVSLDFQDIKWGCTKQHQRVESTEETERWDEKKKMFASLEAILLVQTLPTQTCSLIMLINLGKGNQKLLYFSLLPRGSARILKKPNCFLERKNL